MERVSLQKSFAFSKRIVRLYQYLTREKREFVMAKQILRCGTSIGANLFESKYAQSSADFVSKHSIALKEASEASYWLELLYQTGYISEKAYQSIQKDCVELIRLLTAIIRTSKEKP